MTVDPATTPHRHDYRQHDYFFCCAGCRSKFAAEPRKYLNKDIRAGRNRAGEGAIYTCPMHPQIRQVGPGSCPICGMALEPEAGGADDGPRTRRHDASLLDLLVLAVPVVVARHGRPFSACPRARADGRRWIQFVLATPVVLWGGWPFFVRGAQS